MRPAEIAHSKSVPPPRCELVAWMRGVSRYFDKPRFVRALTDVSLEVRRGEVLGLLGPSGSGKSTTIRILAGRLSTSEGKARVFGRPPRRRAARARVGYLPQRPSHNHSHLWAEIVDFLRDVFIWRQRKPSSQPDDPRPGRERISVLKQVLVRNPDLLLLDEPFATLDAARCAAMKNIIVALARRGKTIILASDSLACAKDVCDRFAVYYAGRIEALGTLDEILATPDAIRLTGPVLPPETAQRVLAALREGLVRPSAVAEPQHGDSPSAPAKPTTVAAAHNVLAPLVGSPGPASNTARAQAASPVNHDRLTALTKPAPTARPPEPERTP